MIKRALFPTMVLSSTCLTVLSCGTPDVKVDSFTDASNTDAQAGQSSGSNTDAGTEQQQGSNTDSGECKLEEIIPDKNAACQGPSDSSVYLMDDGYICFEDSNCKNGKCNPTTYTCGAEELAQYTFSNLPLYSTCWSNSDCASGNCVWSNEQVARCLNKCQAGDSGDGIFSCSKGVYPDSNPDYYCQPDTRVGQKCCSDSDCPNNGICYNNFCSTDCSNQEQGYTCPEGSNCFYFYEAGTEYNLCIADSLKGQLQPGQKCSEDVFCQSGHCNPDHTCADLSKTDCSGPKDYPDFAQPNGYPCNVNQDCASGVCNLTDNAFVCTETESDTPNPILVTNLADNMPCQEDAQCASGYCWYNGGALFGQLGISDASYCAQPCSPDVAKSDGNFACQINNFNKYICSPVRDNKGEKGSECTITEFSCKTNLTCDRVDKVCKGM